MTTTFELVADMPFEQFSETYAKLNLIWERTINSTTIDQRLRYLSDEIRHRLSSYIIPDENLYTFKKIITYFSLELKCVEDGIVLTYAYDYENVYVPNDILSITFKDIGFLFEVQNNHDIRMIEFINNATETYATALKLESRTPEQEIIKNKLIEVINSKTKELDDLMEQLKSS